MPSMQPSHSRPFIFFLAFTSLSCGALVMAIEVLGSRVIGPFFGSSLFVWTSLITVTLVGLAFGYSAGGLLSDRRQSPDYLFGIILISGIVTMCIPFLKSPVLEFTLSLGLRGGALTASLLLFGPSLFLLGCVSPYIIKIAAREISNIGRTVGFFSAVSTVGSFIGTVCTGFILVAYFRVNQIFTFIGGGLILLAVIYFIFFRKKRFSIILLAIPLMIPTPGVLTAKVLANGTTVTRLYDEDTYYGNIKVLEYSYGDNRVRELLLESTVQGGMYMGNRLPSVEYPYSLQYIPYTLNPKGKTCLVVGLGIGAIPLWYESMGITTDVVDINPEIFSVAKRFFSFRNSGESIIEDARYFLNRTSKKYDYVILDVFSGENTPSHILSVETLQVISSRMNDGAILGINLIGSMKKGAMVIPSVVKTVQQVFRTVELYPCTDTESTDKFSNFELIAYNGPPLELDRKQLKSFPFHPSMQSAQERIGRRIELPHNGPGIILTDDYNPVDSWDIQIKEDIRKAIIEYTDREMLL